MTCRSDNDDCCVTPTPVAHVSACMGDTVRLVVPTCGAVRWRVRDPRTQQCVACTHVAHVAHTVLTHPNEPITFVKNVQRDVDVVAETRASAHCSAYCAAAHFAVRLRACAALASLAIDVDKSAGACLGTDFNATVARSSPLVLRGADHDLGAHDSSDEDDDDDDDDGSTESSNSHDSSWSPAHSISGDDDDDDARCKCPHRHDQCANHRCETNNDDDHDDEVADYWWEPSDLVVAGQCSRRATFRPRVACPLPVSVRLTFADGGCTHTLHSIVDVRGAPTISRILLSNDSGVFVKLQQGAPPVPAAAACVAVDTAFGDRGALLVAWTVVESGGTGVAVQQQTKCVADGGERLAINVAPLSVGVEYVLLASVVDDGGDVTHCVGRPRRVQRSFWVS